MDYRQPVRKAGEITVSNQKINPKGYKLQIPDKVNPKPRKCIVLAGFNQLWVLSRVGINHSGITRGGEGVCLGGRRLEPFEAGGGPN